VLVVSEHSRRNNSKNNLIWFLQSGRLVSYGKANTKPGKASKLWESKHETSDGQDTLEMSKSVEDVVKEVH